MLIKCIYCLYLWSLSTFSNTHLHQIAEPFLAVWFHFYNTQTSFSLMYFYIHTCYICIYAMYEHMETSSIPNSIQSWYIENVEGMCVHVSYSVIIHTKNLTNDIWPIWQDCFFNKLLYVYSLGSGVVLRVYPINSPGTY